MRSGCAVFSPTPPARIIKRSLTHVPNRPPIRLAPRPRAQPFCDGSHKAEGSAAKAAGLGPAPLKNEGAEPADFYVCTCGHSKKENGTCDGTHHKVAAV